MMTLKRPKEFFLGAFFLANILAWAVVFTLSKPPLLEASFFAVGQGDAVFLETPEGSQILIDGGPSSAILEKLAKEMPFWDRSIDLMVLSHPEADHLTGLLEVLKRYKVENILWTGVVRQTAEYKEWVRLIKEEGTKIFIAKAGQRIYGGPTSIIGGRTSPGRFGLSVLSPFDDFEGKEMKDSNLTSVVLRLDFLENSFLFTGDLPSFSEKEMILRQADLDSDVLKVGHHGSKTSSSEEFLEKVSPEVAVISAGRDNRYGHPHQEVLARLEKYGIKVMRTDQDGDIKIISDGKNYGVSNFQN